MTGRVYVADRYRGYGENHVPEGATALLREAAAAACGCFGAAFPYELAVTLCGGRKIRELNRTYRGVDRQTDVLSFPLCEPDEIKRECARAVSGEAGELILLGDVFVCVPKAAAQAEEYGHSLRRELAFLTVHGTLHLLGCDHDKPSAERRMRALQREVMEKMGLGIEGK